MIKKTDYESIHTLYDNPEKENYTKINSFGNKRKTSTYNFEHLKQHFLTKPIENPRFFEGKNSRENYAPDSRLFLELPFILFKSTNSRFLTHEKENEDFDFNVFGNEFEIFEELIQEDHSLLHLADNDIETDSECQRNGIEKVKEFVREGRKTFAEELRFANLLNRSFELEPKKKNRCFSANYKKRKRRCLLNRSFVGLLKGCEIACQIN